MLVHQRVQVSLVDRGRFGDRSWVEYPVPSSSPNWCQRKFAQIPPSGKLA